MSSRHLRAAASMPEGTRAILAVMDVDLAVVVGVAGGEETGGGASRGGRDGDGADRLHVVRVSRVGIIGFVLIRFCREAECAGAEVDTMELGGPAI